MTRSELAKYRRDFLDVARAIKRLARDPQQRNPLVFVVGSAFLEYLSKLAYGKGKSAEYKLFIKEYLGAVNPRYDSFVYRFKSGKRLSDLPLQMYHVLRCGIIHSYSLLPDPQAASYGGRDRSIVLAHRKGRKLRHLEHWYQANGDPTCVFVAEDFAADLEETVLLLFRKARQDSSKANLMEQWLKKHPPIQGGFYLEKP